jgi:hypothetical protein
MTPCRPIVRISRSRCSARHRSLRAASAARPCARHRPRSSRRTRARSRASARRPASPAPTAWPGSARGRHGVVGRWGDRQHLADRLDPMRLAMIVDERDHGLNRRSSSAWAKYALALRRISLACRSSRFSRSSAFSFAAMSVGTPGLPAVALGLLHPLVQRLPVQPILDAIDMIAAQREECSPRDPAPAAPHARAPQAKTCSSSCSSWLHLLRSWSLRQTRGGSILL